MLKNFKRNYCLQYKMNQSVVSIWLKLAVCALFLMNAYAADNEKYLLLQELSRHGQRYPLENIQNSTLFTKSIEGELAPTGAASHYILGKNLQAKYSEVFDHYFGPEEIFIRSTGWNRTVQSAMAHVQGIFESFSYKPLGFELDDWRVLPPEYKQDPQFSIDVLKFQTALPGGYYPYPIHTVPKESSDDFFQNSEGSCKSPKKTQDIKKETIKINTKRKWK